MRWDSDRELTRQSGRALSQPRLWLLGMDLRTGGLVFPQCRDGLWKLGHDGAGRLAMKSIQAVDKAVDALPAAIAFDHPRRLIADDDRTRRARGVSQHDRVFGACEQSPAF